MCIVSGPREPEVGRQSAGRPVVTLLCCKVASAKAAWDKLALVESKTEKLTQIRITQIRFHKLYISRSQRIGPSVCVQKEMGGVSVGHVCQLNPEMCSPLVAKTAFLPDQGLWCVAF